MKFFIQVSDVPHPLYSVVRGYGGQPLRGRGCEVSFAVWVFWDYPRTPVPSHLRTSETILVPPYLRTSVPPKLQFFYSK